MINKISPAIMTLLTMIPHAILCLSIFWNHLRVKKKTLLIIFAFFCVFELGAVFYIMNVIHYMQVLIQIHSVLLLAVGALLYVLLVDASFNKLLYVFWVATTYRLHIVNIANWLEARFSPATYIIYGSKEWLLIYTGVLIVTLPLIYLFFQKKIKPSIELEIPAWKNMWIIPFLFTVLSLLYTGSFEITIMSDWRNLGIQVVEVCSMFWVYFIVLRIIEEANRKNELTKLTNELRQQQEIRDMMLHNISHDLRTPIAVISGAAEILSENELGEADRHTLSRITNRVAQLNHMVEEMLELNSICSGSIQLNIEWIEIEELLRNMEEEFAIICSSKNLSLTIASASGSVSVDVYRLYQIFDNLISNAIRHTATGGITITVSPEQEHCIFCVKDTGTGIAPEFLPYLFERFYYIKGAEHGNGLGLSITKSLVEQMGGDIWVKSEYGIGTAFYFTLPYHI